MTYIASFFAGVFLFNCIPHVISGLCGSTFPTPFAKPRGVGRSPAIVNFYWGVANLLVGTLLLARHPVAVGVTADFIALLCGVVAIGTYLSLHFAKVRLQENFGS